MHAAFSRGADLILAGLVAITMKKAESARVCEETRRGYAQPLGRGRDRTVQVRLLGRLMIWIASLYCEPKRRLFGSRENIPGDLYRADPVWVRQRCFARPGGAGGAVHKRECARINGPQPPSVSIAGRSCSRQLTASRTFHEVLHSRGPWFSSGDQSIPQPTLQPRFSQTPPRQPRLPNPYLNATPRSAA